MSPVAGPRGGGVGALIGPIPEETRFALLETLWQIALATAVGLFVLGVAGATWRRRPSNGYWRDCR